MFFKKFMGKPLPPVMGGRKPSSPSPAPTTNTSPSNGGGSSGKNRNGIIGYFFIPTVLATLWLVTIGISLNNSIEIGIFIVVFILTAINILVGKGASKWISLGLAVVMGCIIWGNYNYINSYNPTKNSPTEQSAGQEQVATAPATVEEIPSTERMVWGGEKIVLTGDGEYLLPKGKKSLCITALGMKDGSTIVPQDITIGVISYSTLGSKCQELPSELEGRVIVDFSPGKPWGTKEAIINIYKEYDSKPGGIGQLPFIAIGM